MDTKGKLDKSHRRLAMKMQEEDHMNVYPEDFRCPISMELMKDPVIISTGVTYERRNIERWFFTYKNKTCPATMQCVQNFDVTPNSTLKSLILSWPNNWSTSSAASHAPLSIKHHEIGLLINLIESSPFKVSHLRKLRSIVEAGGTGADESVQGDLTRLGGVEMLVKILVNVVGTSESEYVTFRASEEALAVLHQLPSLFQEQRALELISKPESMKSISIMLQRGTAEARLHALSIFQNMTDKSDYDWSFLIRDQGVVLFKSMLELASDETSAKACSSALEVLIEISSSSKKSQQRVVEAGAICALVELLPDSNRSRCEKILLLIKLLCECAEGRLAFVDHAMGIAAVSEKLLHVSSTATKLGVKILWLICNFHPTGRVFEELLTCGSVKKLLALLHVNGRSSTKDKVIDMFKSHGKSWKRYPCFGYESRDYQGRAEDSN